MDTSEEAETGTNVDLIEEPQTAGAHCSRGLEADSGCDSQGTVFITIVLAMDFSEVGEKGSTQEMKLREILCLDLARAADIARDRFASLLRLTCHSACQCI